LNQVLLNSIVIIDFIITYNQLIFITNQQFSFLMQEKAKKEVVATSIALFQ